MRKKKQMNIYRASMHRKKCVNEFQWLAVLSRIYLRTLHIRCDSTFVTSGSICFIYFDSLCTTFNLIWMSQRFVIEFIEQKYDWKQAHENRTEWWNIEHTITKTRIKWTIKHAHFDKCGTVDRGPDWSDAWNNLLFFGYFLVINRCWMFKCNFSCTETRNRNLCNYFNGKRMFRSKKRIKYDDAIHRSVKGEKFYIFFFWISFCGFMIQFL